MLFDEAEARRDAASAAYEAAKADWLSAPRGTPEEDEAEAAKAAAHLELNAAIAALNAVTPDAPVPPMYRPVRREPHNIMKSSRPLIGED